LESSARDVFGSSVGRTREEVATTGRYWHQWLRRKDPPLKPAFSTDAWLRRIISEGDHPDQNDSLANPPNPNTIHRDWGTSLQNGGTVGAEMFPAKFTFDVNAVPDCTNDYLIFNTGLVASNTKPSIVAYDQLYSTQGSVGGLCNRNGPALMWSYNTNPAGDTTGKSLTSPVLSQDGTKVA